MQRSHPRRFFLAGGPLALGFVAVVVEVEGETTGDGKVLRASHLVARAARNCLELGWVLGPRAGPSFFSFLLRALSRKPKNKPLSKKPKKRFIAS